MTGISNQDLFNGMASLVEDDIAYHVITTDHPHMAEIGLSVFTTGQLYNWMSQRNSAGEFINLKYFDGMPFNPLGANETVEDRILDGKLGSRLFGTSYGNACPLDPSINLQKEWMSFSRWEKKGRTGEYIKTPFNEWKYYNTYSFSDINFYSYVDNDISIRKIPGPFDPNYNLFATPQKHLDEIVSTIITLNDQSRYLPMLQDFYKNPPILPISWLAAHEFIMDIKMSQERCIQWSNTISFVATVGQQRCVKQECVKFKLFLYDFTNPRNPNRTIALNSDTLRIAIPRKDPFGRLARNDGTGDFDLPESDPNLAQARKTIVDLKLGKDGYSGSPMVLVKLATDLEAATWPDIVDDLQEAAAAYCSPNKGLTPGTGLAIPIQEQNGNPLQWAPQYVEQSCKKKSNAKFTITINNFDKKLYPSGAMGYATKFQNATEWSFIPVGQYEDVQDTTPREWSFTYLMMNYDNFFLCRPYYESFGGSPKYYSAQISANAYEEYVRRYYYSDFTQTDKNYILRRLDSFPALQVTSWDFMGKSIGGLRDKHALSCTIWNLNNDGQPWPDYENGFYSTPFFGCVFPGGYQTEGKVPTYKIASKEDFVVRSKEALPQVSKGNKTTVPFIQNIPKGTRIINNQDNDASNTRNLADPPTRFDLGIFHPALENTLNHLPADIATNSSNSPIQNYYHLYGAFQVYGHNNTEISPQDYRLALSGIIGKNYNDRSVWIHPSGKETGSLFNFKPAYSYKLQFRPLKHEIYDSFQRVDLPIPSGSSVGSPEDIEYKRQESAKTARNYQQGLNPPIALNALNKNTWFTSIWSAHGGDFAPIGAGRNSRTGMLISQAGVSSSGRAWSLRYNYGIINVSNKYSLPNLKGMNSNAKFPWHWRRSVDRAMNLDDNYTALEDDKGSGAIGVIGVSLTIALQNKIGFTTNSLFGLRSSVGPSTTVGGFIDAKPWYQAFGGYGDNYNSLHNTQLYARIFQHWPKQYTVYDPSKFAVFHFNTNDDNLDYIDYFCQNNTSNPPTEFALPNGWYVYSDIIADDKNTPQPAITLTTKLNNYRKEKLLPCSYKMEHTIGIDLGNPYIVGGQNNAGPPVPGNYSVVIDNQGSGYLDTNTFKVVGGNGTSPLIQCITNNGKITGFNYVDSDNKGYNYRQEDFLKNNDNFLNNPGGLQIVPVDVNGEGFIGRIVTGIGVISPVLIDSKPKFIGEQFIQLTPSVPVREDPSSSIMEPVADQKIVNIIIDPQNKSKDGLYDVFLHFHNDTSHTLIRRKDSGNPLEQYVELEIIPG